MAKGNKQANDSGLNFEAQLWAAADKMRGHMDASEYKHVVLGLIFLKYISDAYGEKREQLLLSFGDPKGDWFIKDEAQRPEAADERDFSRSASNGERVAVRCRNPRMNRRRTRGVRGKRWPCASTTTWKLARMNVAIRGIDANLGPRNADSFRQDLLLESYNLIGALQDALLPELLSGELLVPAPPNSWGQEVDLCLRT